MSDHHHEEEVDRNLLEEMGYEDRDIKLDRKPVINVTVLFIVFVAVMLGASWLTLTAFDRVEGLRFTQGSTERRRVPPPEVPLVQGNIRAQRDMVDLLAAERATLNSAEFDAAKGTASIPLEDAMRIMSERGLPTRANAGIPADYTERIPVELQNLPRRAQ
jgi:hypothetical protein